MNIRNSVLKTAFALAAFALPFVSLAATGNIYEIRPVDADGNAIAAPTANLNPGEVVRFAVRLMKNDLSGERFGLVYCGVGDKDVAWYSNRPKIGIYVSGELRSAELESVKARNEIFTDLIFTYRVRPGDFALPIRLAGSDGSMLTPNSTTSGYHLDFRTVSSPEWDVRIGGVSTGAQAIFQYGTPISGVTSPESDGRRADYDLSACNFNVQTIDFDTAWEDAATKTVWRTVHQGSSEIDNGGDIPSLQALSLPTNNAYSLYLWSEDESVFRLPAGTDCIQRDIHVTSSTTEKRWVREIKVMSGKMSYTFDLEGVTQGTASANLVLSPFPDYNYSDGTSYKLSDYVTVPVKCSEPSERAVTVAPTDRTVTATSAYTHYVTELKVTFNQVFTEDVEIEIEPSIQDAACPYKWWDYIRFSDATDEDVTLQTNPGTNPTVTIRAGATSSSTRLYIYALRSDEWVNDLSNHILFTPKTTNANALKPVADGGIKGWDTVAGAGLNINAQNPSIDSMFDGTDASTAIADTAQPLQIVVSDTYADMTCTNGGYEIWIVRDKNGRDTKPVKLDGLYLPGKGGVLFLTNTTDVLPTVTYTAEKTVYSSYIYVKSPISGNESANHDFTMTVSAPDRVVTTILSASEYYTGEAEFAEGETVQLKIALQDESGNPVRNSQGEIYAYIKGDSDGDTEAIDCTWKAVAGGVGKKLGAYSDSVSSGCTLVLTDGDGSKLGKFLSYSIVFLKSSTWTDDATQVVSVYKSSAPVTFTVHNVMPSVEFVSINDGTYEVSTAGATVGPFPINVAQKFAVSVIEPGEVDKAATNDAAFRVRWRITDPDGSPNTPIVVEGNPDETSTNYVFRSAGIYTVDVDLGDKDMAGKYGNGTLNSKFSFKVSVIDQPSITLEHNGIYNETESVEAGGEAQVTVKLGLNACDFDMYVKLLLAPNATGAEAPGLFQLQTSANVTTNGTESFNGEDYDSYTIRFPRRVTEMPIFVQSLDGTLNSRTTGFKAVLTNLTETVVPNSGGKRACDYYLGVAPSAIKVYNVEPVLDMIYPEPGTNAIKVAIGQVDEALTWSFTDVVNDFTRGMKVEFKGGGGWGPNIYSNSMDAAAAGAAGFKPTFSSSGAGQTVRLIITDPDGQTATATWTYDVEASKSMKLVAHGPATGYGASKGDRYNTKASGRGEGRVWAASKSAIPVNNWSSTVNCGLEKTFDVFGYGYKVGDIDDGTAANLHYPDGRTGYYVSRDTAINTSGNSLGLGESGYKYNARKDEFGNPVDSFLYTWLVITSSGDAGSTVTDAYLNDTTAPEMSEANDSGRLVTLPTDEDEEGGYALTQLEAVFSIEKYASDNMGDINQDGIPDLYAKKYGMGVYDPNSGAVTGDDLLSLLSFNDDEDYLPDGSKFTAALEIRGYGYGLNDAPERVGLLGVKPDRVYTDPDADTKSTLSKVEYLAWLEYAQALGIDATLATNWNLWSPECPSDPTLEDTDEDGFPDGFEYYHWYRATVGYLEVRALNGTLVTNHLYETGRRFDARNPGAGTVITSAEIARLMNPRLPGGSADEAAARDSDNDGLTDLEELALGTNPFDFDTDGDGLPDGFEVMVSKTDPLKYATDNVTCDAERNFDGDHMAYTSIYRSSGEPYCDEYVLLATEKRSPEDLEYPVSFAIATPDGDTDGVQWYVVADTDLVTVSETTVTEDIVTCEAYDGTGLWTDGASWVKVAIRAAALPAVDAGTIGGVAVSRLYADIAATEAFAYSDDTGAVVRGLPKRLAKGTLVRNAATATEYVERQLAGAIAEERCNAAWVYGNAAVGVGTDETAHFGELVVARHEAVAAGAVVVAEPLDTRKIAYIHSYVYQQFGFDPRTAWKSETPLAARWGTATKDGDGALLTDKFLAGTGYAGVSTRTRPYTTYDEFLLMSYYLNSGCIDASDVEPTKDRPWRTIFSLYTTNTRGPNEPQVEASGSSSVSSNATVSAFSDTNGADTDGDGVPDGWELYVMSGPKEVRQSLLGEARVFRILGPDAPMSPTTPKAASQNDTDTLMDKDGLNEWREFAGTDSCAAYTNVSTTVVRPAADANWLNKFFPTDPWNKDTDGDGLKDGDEGGAFVYGTPADGLVNGRFLTSIPGGGLNPCSVDTDLDGLPDGWEAQFAGKTLANPDDYADFDGLYAKDAGGADVGNCLVGYVDGMDGTVADATTSPVVKEISVGSASSNTISRTISRTYYGSPAASLVNRDYDHDGLENWQEYLVGAMRCWRYDDPFTRWDYIPSELYWTTNDLGEASFEPNLAALACADMDEFWYKTLVDKTSPLYNPWLVTDQASGAPYFSRVTNAWDCAYREAVSGERLGGAYYIFKDRCGDTMIADLWSPTIMEKMGYTKMAAAPTKYISCDPTKADTDQDGMDDYYELFHGLNPLLGQSGVRIEDGCPCDIVYDAWYGDNTMQKQTAESNVWTKNPPKAPRGAMDFEVFPWLAGAADADPDGDDIRNQVEALMPEVGTTTWLHTDPTPLWMTDSTYSNSLVRMFWRLPTRKYVANLGGASFKKDGVEYFFRDFDCYVRAKDQSGDLFLFTAFLPDPWYMAQTGEENWIFSFEENEGYDTDHDGLSDYAEKEGKFRRGGSDPQDSDSPVRRQAMYFQGPAKPSLLQSMPQVPEMHPVGARAYPDDMSFLQYTVECWVCPDTVADDATILERVIWSSPSNVGDEEFLRRNFQLAIRGGRWYTCFDPNGTVANNQVEVVSPTEAVAGVWTHLAATYDGRDLVLYVNGNAVGSKTSGLQPEYGSSAICVRSESQAYWFDREYAYKALLVGASAKGRGDLGGNYFWHLNVLNAVGFSRYKNFYTGYVDEIRVWDGARTIDEIRATMKTRYTSALAQENRNAFYADWVAGKHRYAKDASGNDYDVTPELRYHYSFDSLFGGVDAASVAKEPHGFGDTGAKAPVSRPEGYEIPWWKTVLAGSGPFAGYGSVYDSPAWVSWVPNTVAHLPRFDGTTLDSVYWSEDFKGALQGVYSFARTAEPVSRWTQMTLNRIDTTAAYQTTASRHRLVNDLGDSSRFHLLYEFTGRHLNQMGDDLLPLGGAYAKYCDATVGFWDEQGASSVWEISGPDSDNDGLPNWWEDYADQNYRRADMPSSEFISWDTIVDYDGLLITAGEAYLRDLAKGSHRDGAGNAVIGSDDYRQTADADRLGLPDWWTELYGIKGESALDDHDHDGLPNYVEYLLSEVFKFAGKVFDPTRADSVNPGVPDYFFQVGDLYVGEIFTDHDLVDDSWEALYSDDFASRLKYDPYADADGDGWSNRSENRYAKQVMPIIADQQSHYVGSDELVADYPIPTIALTVNYTGSQKIEGVPFVVQMTTASTFENDMDATFIIGSSSGDTTAGSGTASSSTATVYTHSLGRWSNRHAIGTLAPGYVNKDSVKLEFCHDPSGTTVSWRLYTVTAGSQKVTVKRGTLAEFTADQQKYGEENVSLISTSSDYSELQDLELWRAEDGKTATWIHVPSKLELGTIDLTSGAFDIDLGVFANTYTINATNTADYVSLEDQTFRIAYTVNEAVGLPRKLFLGKATTGHVREGLNTIIAFADLDGDGAYTAGEPYGCVAGVDVSWKGTSADIMLTDTTPIFTRVDPIKGLDDRSALYGTESGNYTNFVSESKPSGGVYDRIRVVRHMLIGTTGQAYVSSVGDGERRVLLDQHVNAAVNPWISEADFLAKGALDVDWETLYDDIVSKISNGEIPSASNPSQTYRIGELIGVVYRIVIGNEDVNSGSGDSNISQVMPVRWFDSVRNLPVPQQTAEGNGVILVGRPTFSWTMPYNANGYTAFKVSVTNETGTFKWTSDYLRMPAADANGVYTWAAPLFVGDTPTGATGVFENGQTYAWSVSAYNAKYKDDAFVDGGTFLMGVQTNGYETGTIPASVRYYGPSAVTNGAVVRVRAYTSPDFTGAPVGGACVTATDADGVNCRLLGLPKGTYYLQAFVDSNGNGVWDKWESMGYLCARDGSTADSLNPVSVTFGDRFGLGEAVTIYIEDADTDGDNLPDAWEYVMATDAARKDGSFLKARGVAELDQTGAGELWVNNTLVHSLLTEVNDNKLPSAGLMAQGVLNAFRSSASFASLALGTPANLAVDPATGALSVDPVFADGTLVISGLAFDTAAGEVALTVSGELAASEAASSIYRVAVGSTVTVKVLHTATLAANWQTVATEKVTISGDTVKSGVIRVKMPDVEATGGFYKVEIEQ